VAHCRLTFSVEGRCLRGTYPAQCAKTNTAHAAKGLESRLIRVCNQLCYCNMSRRPMSQHGSNATDPPQARALRNTAIAPRASRSLHRSEMTLSAKTLASCAHLTQYVRFLVAS
jgi:hypothetical protein